MSRSENHDRQFPRSLAAALCAMALSVTPAQAETLQVVIKTFIPDKHPSLPDYMIAVPGKPDKTMLPKAPVGQCFGTDNRSFSPKKDAPARFGGVITFNTAGPSARVTEITGVTHEFNCSNGSEVCTETAGAGGFAATISVSGDKASVAYKGEASNPCLTIAPDIEFSGTVTLDTRARTVSIDGAVDVFPSFEAFVIKSDDSTVLLYQVDPKNKATPADLLTSPSGGSRPVKKTVTY